MTTTLAPSIEFPPEAAWAPGLGRRVGDGPGAVIESDATEYDHILESPAVELPGQRRYTFEVSLEIVGEGGVTVGLQDGRMKFWLKEVNHTGAGPTTCTFSATVRRTGKYRIVIANYRPDGPGKTRVRNISVRVTSSEVSPERDAEDWKDEARRQWNTDHCGHDRGEGHDMGSLEYFLAIEKDRYQSYAPWMPRAIAFDQYGGKKLLEIGGGLGTDHAQFAKSGAHTTDLDLAEGHLDMARRNFAARGLDGEFILGDGEELPFADASFDVIYSFGVIHHTPHTESVVKQMHRVLKPGGEAIVMVYAKHSKYYWYNVVYKLWFRQGMRRIMTVDEILSAKAEWSPSGAEPLVKVYTARQCRKLFADFSHVRVRKFQLMEDEVPSLLLRMASAETWSRLVGWNLVINAIK